MGKLLIALVLMVGALALELPAQGGGTSGGSGYNACAPAAAAAFPAPAPVPAPAPAPAPSPAPGGATPAPAGGGATPGTPGGGGSTPGGGGTGGATPGGGGGFGGGPAYGGKKVKISREQKFWLGAITLPWEAGFLKVSGEERYGDRELSMDEAVANGGWAKRKLPTLVFIYDPSAKADMSAFQTICEDTDFIAASYFFNLVRLDRRTVKDKDLVKSLGDEHGFVSYRANGTRIGEAMKARTAKEVLKIMSPVFEKDFVTSMDSSVALMRAVLARRAFIEDEIKRHEAVVICPLTGVTQHDIKEELVGFRKELSDLKIHEERLTTLSREAFAAK